MWPMKKLRTIEVLNRNLLLILDARETETAGGIALPEVSQKANVWGTVKAHAEDCVMNEWANDMRVLIPPTAGSHYRVNGVDYIIVCEDRIIACAMPEDSAEEAA